VRADECALCKRRRVLLLVRVHGRLWGPAWNGRRLRKHRVLPVGLRASAVCLDQRDCRAYVDRKRKRQELRGKLPADAILRELHPEERGRCKWCGEAIYRRDKAGRIVVDRRRMWHEGREVDPRAEPEPRCVQEYQRQAFTFRDQVWARDGGVCAGCGLDLKQAIEEHKAQRPRWEEYERGDSWDGGYWAVQQEWVARRPTWEADHVVPLEDGGEHLLANAQLLCSPCHRSKTGAENSARARRRRPAPEPSAQMALDD
jgi:5-methylcytosine-specific restriction endonuclease McrA